MKGPVWSLAPWVRARLHNLQGLPSATPKTPGAIPKAIEVHAPGMRSVSGGKVVVRVKAANVLGILLLSS
jgi:hypothetical protein